MTKKLSDKRKAHIASLSASRWKSKDTAKENILPPVLIPPRATTRAQTYLKSLEDTISAQNNQILVLQESNLDYRDQYSALTTELDTATSYVQTLEIQNTAITEQLADAQDQLHEAQDVISAQSDTIRQKNQRINRLARDKAVLSGKIACKQQELAQAILSAAAAEKVSKATALEIETMLHSISRLNATASAQKAAKSELYKDLRATRMRETRAKSAVQKLRKELAAKSRWSGKNRHAYSSQSRSLAMAFVKAGCAQSRIGPLLSRVGKVLGVKIKRSMSRRTVGRVITEAGIKVRIQLGHELARAKVI
jgi:DNA repair exonuclease SbcCD ATPase subunit